MADKMNLIKFFEFASELKKIKRTGWIQRGIPNPESVADHSFRLALMALVLGKKLGMDVEKAVKMALVHDLPEAITGDISRDNIDEYDSIAGIKPSVSDKKKIANEAKALKQIVKLLDKKSRQEIVSLYMEFEERKTKTARLLKELDNLECLLQALEYKRAHPENKRLYDFVSWTKKFCGIKNSELKKIAQEIVQEFEEIEKGK